MKFITEGARAHLLQRIQCLRDIGLLYDDQIDTLIDRRRNCCPSSSSTSSTSSSSSSEFLLYIGNEAGGIMVAENDDLMITESNP